MEWHTDIDNCAYTIIEDAGHCANMYNPLEFNILVDEFIQRLN